MFMDAITTDIQGLKIILWIAGFILTIMVGIIGYFLKQQIDASKDLTTAVNDLTKVVAVIQAQVNINNPVNEKRLNDHSGQLDDHEKRIVIIETEHKNFHCKYKE